MRDLLRSVKESTAKVVNSARHVSLNGERLTALSQQLNPSDIASAYRYEGEFYFKDSSEQLLNYVFTLNAVNFGSGLSHEWRNKRKYPGSSFKSTADGLKRLAQSGVSLDAQFAASIAEKQIAQILGVDPGFRLVSMFRQSLNELGRFVSEKYGSYASLIESLDPQTRAARLAELLFSNLKTYHDVSRYHGSKVFFLKRAQIISSDLFLAFEGKGYGEIHDIDQLTMFADNLLPHYFRVEGVLTYADDLLGRITRGEEIPAGSEEEIEIRAFAVQAVEQMKELLQRKEKTITAAMIDNYIWHAAQDLKYKSLPRHRTVTWFY